MFLKISFNLARSGQLSTGDRIVQVGDTDIQTSDQDKAVQAIASAGNPIRLVVQSLHQYKVCRIMVKAKALLT